MEEIGPLWLACGRWSVLLHKWPADTVHVHGVPDAVKRRRTFAQLLAV
jgi:hypothetical protein